jgi:hypothetical protein
VLETSTGEPADGAIEKILVLVELDDVIARGGARYHSVPGLKLTLHRRASRLRDFPR